MAKRKTRPFGLHLVIIGTLLIIIIISAWAAASSQPVSSDSVDAGLIVINELNRFGALQRPAVIFPHDRHTRTLTGQQQDCLTCHPADEGRFSLKFKRLDPEMQNIGDGLDNLENMDRLAIMDLYHENCIACHRDIRRSGKDSGPETCGECHRKDGIPDIERLPMQLDKYLHFRHTRAMNDRCDQCHHQYNEETEKLEYIKGREGACLYCHKEQTEDNRISNRKASHIQCISCHLERSSENQTAGPIQCMNCHDPGFQALIERPEVVPRMERNQPDALIVRRFPADTVLPSEQTGMGPVPFDHLSHESYNDSCRVCHHADLGSCVACHSIAGTTEGAGVKLDQAMHSPSSEMSCVGCHRQVQQHTSCVGCHHTLPPSASLAAQACQGCHTDLPESVSNPANQEAARTMAAQLLEQRPGEVRHVAADRIPETVTISRLVDQYEPAVMPHRKIVLSLAEGVADNPLAIRFHTQSTTLCQGCHHNSPGSLTPPSCTSCHANVFTATDPSRPGLLAAYHRQCMDCHEHMGIAKPASRECTACHALRNPERANR